MEEWVVVPGFEGLYMVSNLGRVMRYLIDGGAVKEGNILKPMRNPQKYETVRLYSGHCEYKDFRLHRLVATVFLGDPPSDVAEVNHKNGIVHDNRVENLEWVTRGENQAHAYRVLGRRKLHGEASPRAKLTDDNAREIRRAYAAREANQTELGKRFGVCQRTIWAVLRHVSFRHIIQ